MKKRLYFLFILSFFLIETANSQTTIVLQPGPEGKDAYLNDYYTTNYGDYPNAFCMAWTHSGIPFTSRSVFEFDLTSIPPGSIILDARLSLYCASNPSNQTFHYGDNRAYLQRITEPWDEHEVTWHNQPATTTENQVELPASIFETQDYSDIDISMLIQDMTDDPENSHGILIKLQVEEMYRSLMFASGDHENPLKWPKLEITYTTSPLNTIIIQSGQEGKDAQLWSIMPDNNYGNTPKFVAMGWTHYGEPGVNRAIIDWDLSIIPEGSQIVNAKLNFYFVCLEPNYFGHTGENEAYLNLITEPWEEDDVTWNTQPEVTQDFQVYLPPSTDPYMDYTDIDVTVLVQKLFGEPEDYHGLMLRLLNENPYRCLLFASGDYADTVEMRPKLEVTYSTAPTNTVEIQPGPEDGKDAQLWTIMPDNNYGNIPKFDCSGWTHGGVPGVNRGIIDFDLSSIPDNAVITDAKLNLYFVCLEPTYFGHTGENDAFLQLITDPWEENTVTWNTQPSTTEDSQVYLPPSTDPYMDYTDLDVTALIQKLYSEPEIYHGIMLRLLNENPYRCLLFASSDLDTAEMRPKLVVTYTLGSILPIADFNYETEGLNIYFENTSTDAEEYWWDFGDGYYSDLENPWHIYDQPGVYTITLTVWNDYGSDTIMKTITVPTAIAPEQYMAILKVYPNVAQDQITLSTNIIGMADMVIVDSYGRPVIHASLEFSEGETHPVNVSQLNPGFYFARITKGNLSDTRKLIISR